MPPEHALEYLSMLIITMVHRITDRWEYCIMDDFLCRKLVLHLQDDDIFFREDVPKLVLTRFFKVLYNLMYEISLAIVSYIQVLGATKGNNKSLCCFKNLLDIWDQQLEERVPCLGLGILLGSIWLLGQHYHPKWSKIHTKHSSVIYSSSFNLPSITYPLPFSDKIPKIFQCHHF